MSYLNGFVNNSEQGALPKGWYYKPLSDLISHVVDNRGRSAPTSESGIKLIATNCIKNSLLYPVYEKVRYVSEQTYRTWFRDHPKPGDIIIVNKGTPGLTCLVPETVDFCIAQDMVAIRANQKYVTNNYLFAALRSKYFLDQVASYNVGTTIPHLKKTDFPKLMIPVPPSREMEFIGDVYFDISKKIDINQRMNQTLEAMARAIFKSWFVDFDPVHAKAEGRATGLPEEIDALFPDGFEESVMGEIPKGWSFGVLNDIANNPRFSTNPKRNPSHIPYIGLEHMPIKSIALSEWEDTTGLASNKFQFNRGDILFGKLRPYFHKVGIAPVDGVCSTDILVIRSNDPLYFSTVLNYLSSDEFIKYTDTASTGTKMPRTNWGDMARYQIVVPPNRLAEKFNSIVKPHYDLLINNIYQVTELKKLRDELLPRLIRGEIIV